MTVADLIEKLRSLDPMLKVVVCEGDADDYYAEAKDIKVFEPAKDSLLMFELPEGRQVVQVI